MVFFFVANQYHGSDIFPSNFTIPYVVNFANHLDPNIGSDLHWPEYITEGPESETLKIFILYNTVLGVPKVRVEHDRYREDAIAYLTQLAYDHAIVVQD